MKNIGRLNSPGDLEKLRQEIQAKSDLNRPIIAICVSTGCNALGAQKVVEAFKTELEKCNKDEVEIRLTGCLGFCELGPRVIIYPEETYYFKVKPEDVPEIVSKTVIEKQVIERLLYTDLVTGKKIRKLEDVPFYKHQLRLLLENNAKIDPKEI